MKLIHAFLIVILCIVIQVSFVRLFDFFSFMPNLALVILFLLCYFLSFENVLILSIFAGLSIDLVSSVNFGSTILAVFGACALSFYLRENLLRGGRFVDFMLNSLIFFPFFYFLLGGVNILFGSLSDYEEIFNLINLSLAGEILLDLVFSALGYYLAGYFNSSKIYGFIQNIKISS